MRHLCLFLTVCGLAPPLSAQRQEVGLTLGRLLSDEHTSPAGRLDLGSGTALQTNYGIRIVDFAGAALLGEVHLLASPLRDVTTAVTSATRDFATLYLTPGVRVKLAPDRRISPYFAVGAGWAWYEQSTMSLGGNQNPAPRNTHRGVINFGGGVDVSVLRWLGLRFEIRDFYSGNPSLNISIGSSGLHNVVAGGGFVLRF